MKRILKRLSKLVLKAREDVEVDADTDADVDAEAEAEDAPSEENDLEDAVASFEGDSVDEYELGGSASNSHVEEDSSDNALLDEDMDIGRDLSDFEQESNASEARVDTSARKSRKRARDSPGDEDGGDDLPPKRVKSVTTLTTRARGSHLEDDFLAVSGLVL